MGRKLEGVAIAHDPDFGYNALIHEYGELLKMGVTVPTKVERIAFQNAASIASLPLTTDAVVSEIEEEKPKPAGPARGVGCTDSPRHQQPAGPPQPAAFISEDAQPW